MAITKKKKQQIVKDLADKISRAKSIIFTKFFGVSANDINSLRASFREQNSEYVVAKKTLMDKAFEKTDITGVAMREIDGEVAAVFGYEDEVAPAKTLGTFAKTHAGMQFVGGVLERRFIDAGAVQALAKLPSKLELYAKLVGSIQAPVSGFVNVLAGNLRGLVVVLKAIEEKKQ
ncbi:50S ribosomal protein L10 [Candidatus Falkowbacteria bacterium RIFOXYC2_FULL_47_12]|uniref:Large ribosomal subunit protein uL10 n=2 Tax=Candidatus Falkowiibacteriota TaxID=1752728 RepID=A0A1F5TR39_9BACT|nr:MAG: 50S ribosomal protein L10 [Candidatus Falkowbacteria bacterium RIFOXYA2_FULL_47_9]OGF41383.1 MAG: 50S ribosomal protein L10 [Candidatus Falkowbacteria bacterium RIFOXYC2_FULL_47_12]